MKFRGVGAEFFHADG